MAAETIREYLVALGFKIDDTAFRKFNSAVLKSAEPVMHLGAAATATATAIGVMVETVARQMEDLYYASQRSYATAASIQAVGFAAQQVGLSAAKGTNLLEGLGRALRTNPGTEGLIQSLGVQTREANGHLRDTGQMTDALLQRFASMPRFEAMQFGSMLGWDPETLNQILNNLPQFIQGQKDATKAMREFGLNQTQVSADAAEFDRHVNALERDFGLLTERVAHDWMPVAEKMIEGIDALVVDAGKLNYQWGGMPGKIASVVVAMGGLYSAMKTLSKARSLLLGAGEGAAVATAGETAAAATGGGLLSSAWRFLGPAGAFLGTLWGGSLNQGEDAWLAAHRNDYHAGSGYAGGSPPVGPRSGAPLGIRSNNPGNLMPGGHEATFGSAYEGIRAMAGNLLNYAAKGWNTLETIVAHWAPGSAGNDVGAYISDLMKRTGFGANQALNLLNPQTLERLVSAIIFHENGQNPYSAGLINSAVASKLGYGGVTINQRNETTITGTADPAAAGRHVGEAQARANGDLARNLATVVR